MNQFIKENKYISQVIEYMQEARKLLPEVTDEMLYTEGQSSEHIFYMNGTNGTFFDWCVNEHLSAFMMFYKETELGFIKVFVHNDGTMGGCIYPDLGNGKRIFLKEAPYSGSPEGFASMMRLIADDVHLFDASIDRLAYDLLYTECSCCHKKIEKDDMMFTKDCHGIPFRYVCPQCYVKIMAKGYDGEYYTEADECIDEDC